MQAMTAAGSTGMLSVLRPGHHEIDFAATALRTSARANRGPASPRRIAEPSRRG